MEIDHHNPTLTGAARNRYENLFLAVRHCNNAKGDRWPSNSARRRGIRFLNPCKEMDYGEHIVEHPKTHRLIGLTPAGDYHITNCDLNAPHFVTERQQRAAIHELLNKTRVGVSSFDQFPAEVLGLLREQIDKMIPLIQYLPKTHYKFEEELVLMEALENS